MNAQTTTPSRTRITAVNALRSTSFVLPFVLACAYLSMGQSSCGDPVPVTCQGQVATLEFKSTSVDSTLFIGTAADDVIVLTAGPGPVTLHAGLGNDLVCVRWNSSNNSDITIYGGEGNDTVHGSGASEVIYGQEGNDVLNGGAGDDHIEGEEGFDQLLGQEGDDVLLGGDDDDVLWGDAGQDFLGGGDGDDLLFGGADHDVLGGGNGDDQLFNGEDPTGTLTGGAGNDTATVCGAGFDLASIVQVEDIQYSNDPACSCEGEPATHVFASDSAQETAFIASGGDDVIVLMAGPGPRNVYAGIGDDLVCVRWSSGQNEAITVYGGEGHDTVHGSEAGETLLGEAGNDVLVGHQGDDRIEGGEGSDFLIGDAGNDVILGGDGDDQVWGQDGDDTLWGDAGNDTLYGGTGSDWFAAGYGDDRLFDTNSVSGYLNGGPGNDSAHICGTTLPPESFFAVEDVQYSADLSCPGNEPPVNVRVTPLALEVIEEQEGTRDEPYFAVVRFSTRFGAPGSTHVEFIDAKVQLGPVREGGEADFPAWIQDALEFGERSFRTDPTGTNVSVDGVMFVAMEDDLAGWDPLTSEGVRDTVMNTADCLESAFIEDIESKEWSLITFGAALLNVGSKLENCNEITLHGKIKQLIGDDPMGSAFIVRLGVSDSYFKDAVAPLFAGGRPDMSGNADCQEVIYPGCVPFLANPCAMRDDPNAFTRYSSICSAASPLGNLSFPFESNQDGAWNVDVAF